jgi:hypothetical protein
MLHHQQPHRDSRPTNEEAMEPLRIPSFQLSCSSIDLSTVTDRLEAHNERTGFGPTLARLLTGTLSKHLARSPNSKATPHDLVGGAVRKESSLREAARDQFEAEVAPLLAAIGLSIGPVKSGWGLYGAGRDIDSKKLSLHIEDTTRFAAYLESLDAASITPSQKRGLSELYLTLCQQITSEYDPSSGDDRLLALVGAAGSMIEHYERLGLPATRLSNFLAAIRGRYLNAYIEVEKLQLDTPPEKGDGYRLLWHRDTTPERLQAEWNRVLDVLGDLSANPNARQVYDIARHTAGTAVARSITEVSQWPSEAGETLMAHKPIFTSILQAVKLRMREF